MMSPFLPAAGFDLPSLRRLFEPSSIAVIGASDDPARIGGRVIAGNLHAGFGGGLFPVNPRRDTVQGIRAFPDVASIASSTGTIPDLAVAAVPAAQVPAAVMQCADAGVRAAVVLSSGFAETGPEGAALQRKAVETARRAGMRLMGPNCMGFLNARAGLVASFTRILNPPSAFDGICVLGQSGAVGAHFSHVMRTRRMRYEFWGATGNQADVDFADGLAFLSHWEAARVVVGCIEGVADGARFIAALDMARQRRLPVVLVKIGRSEVGGEAAATHTAAMAGSGAVFDEVLRAHGAQGTDSIEEALDIAYACSSGRRPARRSIGLASTSGGFGVMMADAAEEQGLDVPALPREAQDRLRAIVPFAGTRNPVDMTGQYLNDEAIVEPMLESLVEAGDHDAVLTYVGGSSTMPTLGERFAAVAARHSGRLFAFVIVGFDDVAARLERAGCLVFEDPRRAVAAIGALVRFEESFSRPVSPSDEPVSALPAPARSGAWDEAASKALLAQAGVPMVGDALVRSPGEAATAAAGLGYPVVLKVVSADIPHKSDIGGVVLGVAGEAEARAAYDAIMRNVAYAAPAAAIEGVLVAPQIGAGIEMILGSVRDATFGPCVMLGMGGIFAEAMGDRVLRLAPVDRRQALEMIGALKGASLLLKGARGRQPADLDALADAVVALSRLAAAGADWLDSVDINPLIVRAQGQGAVAVDALVVVGTDGGGGA
jgi:acyl-CoA synthetase (NDP forming)